MTNWREDICAAAFDLISALIHLCSLSDVLKAKQQPNKHNMYLAISVGGQEGETFFPAPFRQMAEALKHEIWLQSFS